MSNDLEIFNDILYLRLRPWKVDDAEQRFQQLLHDVKKESYQYQPLHEVAFAKPVSAKRRYYHALIENEAISYLNTIHTHIASALNEQEKKYWVTTALHKKLKSGFTDVKDIIESKKYILANINLIQDDAYIIQCLKYQYIRLYLEIQNSYTSYLHEEPITEAEIHLNYFSDPASEKPIIVEAKKIDLPQLAPHISIQPQPPSLTVQKTDIREPKKDVLTYQDMIKNPIRFAAFEEELFVHELIDKDYNFTNKHGQMQVLAAVYHTLIKKGYFHKRYFQKKRDITPLDVRKFLDHRYNASVDKQFRTWANTFDALAAYIENVFWLRQLPVG